MFNRLNDLKYSFKDIFDLKTEDGKGRAIFISATLLTSLYNLFVGGLFYTGFLTMYGMSITDAGILSFVPFIANMLSVFSPKILGKFKKRKKILLTAKVIYFFLNTVVITAMPNFVELTKHRMMLFIGISAFATGFFTLFNSGFTVWFYNFYPKESERRSKFFNFSLIFSSVISNAILLISSIITDALNNSPYQNTLIIAFRYFAFVLVLVEVFLQSRAKEYPYEESEDLKIKDVITLPLQNKKFMRCNYIMWMWCFVVYINNLWGYHLLNHLEFSYTLINSMSVFFALFLVFFSSPWRKILRRYSWIKTFGLALLIHAPSELVFFFMGKGDEWVYVVIMLFQHLMSVGINLTYGNILYINLPKKNSTAFICFNTVTSNIFSFLGLGCGTLLSSFTGDVPVQFMGMEFYSIQLVLVVRFIIYAIFGLWMVIGWRKFTSDELIEEVEEISEGERIRREARRTFKKA